MPADPLIGKNIDGYTIERLLGRGGMARVYRGLDENLQRHVAVKVIDPKAGDDVDYQERFKKEARAIAQLRHTNIVGVYRFGEVDGHYYMAMDYIEGVDLAWILDDYVKDRTLMPHKEILHIVNKVGRALDYSHRNGVIHRDIKPSNIMLDLTGEPILTDFGLVMITTEETQGDVFGSPHYIAPEQAISSAGTVPQSDLYSLGVMIYQMLVGEPPFTDGTPMQIAMSHMTTPLPMPQKLNPALSTAFNPFLEQALAKDPENRFQSGAEMAKALKDAMQQAAGVKPKKGSKPAPKGKAKISDRSLRQKVEKYQVDHPTTTPIRTVAPLTSIKQREGDSKRGGRTLLIALLAFLIIGGGSAFAVTQMGTSSDAATSNAEIAPLMSVQGRVRAIDGNALTIYGMRVTVPDDSELVEAIGVGDIVRFNGNYTLTNDGMRFSEIREWGIIPQDE